MEDLTKGKKLNALNIVSTRVNHRGFGAGSIDLNNVSGIIIDGDEAYLDNGTLHAKSKVEKRIRFSANKEDVPNGRKCWIIWVAVDRNEEGQFYAGLAACEMLIDSEARRGWKILADHVNRMDKAMKRHVLVENLNETEKKQVKDVLMGHSLEWWDRSSDELKEALSV
ncbi:YwhD family protein [Paenibacillus sp. J2TS4]|uniref:YwhD family protein n=1 Tax=Paenibacillus sp. J2TS4 TaxID=2807194 RepID=UPI001B2C604F|nr:YwhD family protein [Paenibacillus sp. J2TS4]GIP36549.1 hypothetical protein J2TS4_57590 [Paenibacillus sp. J2TS4]